MSCLIIAEGGVNHNGDVSLAEKLVDAGAAAGADLVKFQTFSAARLATRAAPKAGYQGRNDGRADEGQFEMLRRLELTPEAHRLLIERCRSRGVGFFSTAFDLESLELLVSLGFDRFKIPSGEITNLPYLRRVGSLGREVFLSTGMSTLGEVEAAVEALCAAGAPRERIVVLHCNTDYPTRMHDVNLSAMRNLGRALGVRFGYSDHTEGIEVAVAAVALGACVIEKHFTLDRSLPGPDHRASLEPVELAAMVRAIRNVESAMGDGIKRPSAGEAPNRAIARKSLVAARVIRRGELLTADNITAKRPGTGVSPMRLDEVVGRLAARDYAPDDPIET
jgi:N,N'-diacetyllegionaminate synthase